MDTLSYILPEMESLLSDFSDSDEEDGDDEDESNCCFFMFICPWNARRFNKQLRRHGVELAAGQQATRHRQGAIKEPKALVKPFYDVSMGGLMKPVYVTTDVREMAPLVDSNAADYRPYSLVPYAAKSQYLERPVAPLYERFSNGYTQGADTNVLKEYSVEVLRSGATGRWFPDKMKSMSKIRVSNPDKSVEWSLWKDAQNFCCVFGVKMSANNCFYLHFIHKRNKVRLKKGLLSAPTVASKKTNDQRLFKIVHKSNKLVIQHVLTKQYLAVNGALFLTACKTVAKAEAWEFRDWVKKSTLHFG